MVGKSGCAERVAPIDGQALTQVTRWRARRSRATPASIRSWVTKAPPTARARSRVKAKPPTQHSGIGVQMRSVGPMPDISARLRAWRTSGPWPCTTPLGSPVEPDV